MPSAPVAPDRRRPLHRARGLRMAGPRQVILEFGPKAKGLHNDGINIEAPRGTPVYASAGGIVALPATNFGIPATYS